MKVLFDLAKGQITIEGDGPDLIAVLEKAREIAPKLAEIHLTTGVTEKVEELLGAGKSKNDAEKTDQIRGVPTLREFAKMVSPSNTTERIITIAAYQERYHGNDSFSPKEMADWFSHSGFEKPTQMPVALFTAKKRTGFVENHTHGRWRLTVAGENAVTRKLEGKANGES